MEASVITAEPPARSSPPPARPWSGVLTSLTPGRCRMIFAAVVLFGFFAHLRYLTHRCPIDLSGDEAHYWDWSRQLDYNYYSKGPLVALIIRGSCLLWGADTMPAVRFPALLFAVATTLLTYWLIRRIFKSDRLALGTVLLTHFIPMCIAGSLLMTVDPAFYFACALSTAFAYLAIFEERRGAWVALGLAMGFGILAKFGMLVWPAGLFVFLLMDKNARRLLRTPWPYVAEGISLLFLLPALVWNLRHHWVTFKHVAGDTAPDGENTLKLATILGFPVGQVGILGPPLAVIMVAAIVYTFSRRSRSDPFRRALVFLAALGLTFWAIVAADAFFNKVQPNWPAPAYFTLIILTGYFLSTRLESFAAWRPWRPWLYGTILLGVVVTPIVHDTALLYPLVPHVARLLHRTKLTVRSLDPTVKLKGYAKLGEYVSRQLKDMAPGTFILAEDYQTASELAFYTAGQPKTYSAGSYAQHPKHRTQFDIWPDRDLAQPGLRGRDAVYVGERRPEILGAFDSVERLADLTITPYALSLPAGTFPDEAHPDPSPPSLKMRSFPVWKCHNFHGLTKPAAATY